MVVFTTSSSDPPAAFSTAARFCRIRCGLRLHVARAHQLAGRRIQRDLTGAVHRARAGAGLADDRLRVRPDGLRGGVGVRPPFGTSRDCTFLMRDPQRVPRPALWLGGQSPPPPTRFTRSRTSLATAQRGSLLCGCERAAAVSSATVPRQAPPAERGSRDRRRSAASGRRSAGRRGSGDRAAGVAGLAGRGGRGRSAAARGPESVRGKTLIVRVDSSAYAHELTLLKGEILERLRRALGGPLIDDMRTRVGPLRPVDGSRRDRSGRLVQGGAQAAHEASSRARDRGRRCGRRSTVATAALPTTTRVGEGRRPGGRRRRLDAEADGDGQIGAEPAGCARMASTWRRASGQIDQLVAGDAGQRHVVDESAGRGDDAPDARRRPRWGPAAARSPARGRAAPR